MNIRPDETRGEYLIRRAEEGQGRPVTRAEALRLLVGPGYRHYMEPLINELSEAERNEALTPAGADNDPLIERLLAQMRFNVRRAAAIAAPR